MATRHLGIAPKLPDHVGRLGEGVPSEGANAVRFLAALKANLGNVSWLVVGDSTGNATDEWVYLAATALGAQFPAYTVVYHLWDPTGGAAYDTGGAPAATTIQTGSGSNTLHVWNCSVTGQGTTYVRGSRWAAAVLAITPDYITVNYGHNEGTALGGVTTDGWRTQMLALTESLSEAFPVAELALVLQNPRLDGTPDPERRARAYREIAELRGYGIIDVQSVFLAQPSLTGLVAGDNVHPTTGANSGQTLWSGEVNRVLTWSREARPRSQGPSLLTTPAPALIVNGDLAEFTPPALAGWTATNCTPAKDTRSGWFESANGYSVRLQASSAAQTFIYQDVPAGLLPSLLGRYVAFAVRLRVAAGQPTTAGRVQVADSVSNFSAASSADLRDGFHWAVATKLIDPAATFVRVRIYADTGTSSSADISVSEAHLVVGPVPRSSVPVRTALALPRAKRIGTVASSATPTASWDSHDAYHVTAAAVNMVVGAPTGTPGDEQPMMFRFKDNGTARTIGWNAVFRAMGATLPTTTVANKTLYVGTVWNAADSKADVLAVGQEP